MKKLALLFCLGLFLPALAGATDFHQVNKPGWNDAKNVGSTLIKVNGRLEALTAVTADADTDAEAANTYGMDAFRKHKKKDQWKKINSEVPFIADKKNVGVTALTMMGKHSHNKMDDTLFVALKNENGAEIWKKKVHNRTSWQQVGTNGWFDTKNTVATTMFAKDGVLYVFFKNTAGHAEIGIWNGTNIQRKGVDGLGYNISKVNKARPYYVNDESNLMATTEEGKLLATTDWLNLNTWDVKYTGDAALTAMNVGNINKDNTHELYFGEKGDGVTTGAKFWRTKDLSNFAQSGINEFTGEPGNKKINKILTSVPDHRYLEGKKRILIATENDDGFQLWHTKDSINWKKVANKGFDKSKNTKVMSIVRYRNHRDYEGKEQDKDDQDIDEQKDDNTKNSQKDDKNKKKKKKTGPFGSYLSTYNEDGSGVYIFNIGDPFKPKLIKPDEGATISKTTLKVKGHTNHNKAKRAIYYLDGVKVGKSGINNKGYFKHTLTGLTAGEHVLEVEVTVNKHKKSVRALRNFTVQ